MTLTARLTTSQSTDEEFEDAKHYPYHNVKLLQLVGEEGNCNGEGHDKNRVLEGVALYHWHRKST